MLPFENKFFEQSLYSPKRQSGRDFNTIVNENQININKKLKENDSHFLEKGLSEFSTEDKENVENRENHVSIRRISNFNPNEKKINETDTTIINKPSGHYDFPNHLTGAYFEYEYIDPEYNIPNNYNQYISKSIKSINQVKNNQFYMKYVKKELTKIKKRHIKSNSKHSSVNSLVFGHFSNSKPHKKLLLLDLDETLVRTSFEYDNNINEVSFLDKKYVKFYDSEENKIISMTVFFRPGVHDFIKTLSAYYEIGLFTAAHKEYADAVLSVLDPENQYFSRRFYREDCIKVGRSYVKDLSIINHCLSEVVLVDNSLFSFCNQLSNGVLIYSFYDDHNDIELFNIQLYLIDYLYNSIDVRYVNEQVFGFGKLADEM